MADILVQIDTNNLVPKLGITDAARTTWLQSYAIYDINANGTKSGPYGPSLVPGKSGDVSVDVFGTPRKGPTGDLIPGLVSGAGNAPTLFVVSDSIQGQTVDAPRAGTTFGGTQFKGSYYDSVTAVKTVGVTNVYAESPCRVKFRAAHNLVTGEELMLYSLPSNHPLACRRYIVTVTTADELTLNNIDATSMAPVVSGSAATDALAFVDMAFSNASPLPHMLDELGHPFGRIDGVMRPGATSAQLAAVIGSQWPAGRYDYGILHCGRNDAAFDAASLTTLRDAMLARCSKVMVCLTYPDGSTANGYTSATGSYDAAALAKLKSIGEFWDAQQSLYPAIKVCDLFGVISNPAFSLESAIFVPQLLASDGTHPTADGSLLLGQKMAAEFPALPTPGRALSRVGSGSANLLTGARFTGAAGTVGSGVTGTVATGWTVGGRSSVNVAGGYVQVCRTPAVMRANGAVYVAGDSLDIGDGWWYVVKTGGTTAASLPAGYASAVLYDSATGVTDGTAVVFRIHQAQVGRERVEWQLLDLRITTDGGSEHISFFQSISLPGSVAVGDYLRGQADVVHLAGRHKGQTLRISAIDGSTNQLARGHGQSIKNFITSLPPTSRKPIKRGSQKLRVPASTASLELRLTTMLTLDGCQFLVALPVLEETSAPGSLY